MEKSEAVSARETKSEVEAEAMEEGVYEAE